MMTMKELQDLNTGNKVRFNSGFLCWQQLSLMVRDELLSEYYGQYNRLIEQTIRNIVKKCGKTGSTGDKIHRVHHRGI